MSAVSRSICRLLSLSALTLATSASHAGEPVPTLQPLQAGDLPTCGCRYGEQKGIPLISWSWDNARQNALIRDSSGVRKLSLRSEKYFPPEQHPARPGDRMTLQLAQGDWSIQTVNEVIRSCAPKAKRCEGTDYRSRLILQWQGVNRTELQGWGHCSCG